MEYLTPANFENCKTAFYKWMNERYAIDIDSVPSINFQSELYNIMKFIKSSVKDKTVADMNNMALNALQKKYVDKLHLVKQQHRPNPKTLERDAKLFGDRGITMSTIAQATRITNEDVEKTFERMMTSRTDNVMENSHPGRLPFEIQRVDAINNQDFENKLKLMEKERQYNPNSSTPEKQSNDQGQIVQPSNVGNDMSFLNQDQEVLPQGESNIHMIVEDNIMNQSKDTNQVKNNHPPQYINNNQIDIIPVAKQNVKKVQNYVTINGFDRNWSIYKNRYKFAINFSDFSRSYKNISSIDFACIVLPLEMNDCKTLNNPQPKTLFYHEQKFGYPYILLQVDELTNVYDGLNDQVRRSAAQFIFHKLYKCPNGRGYVVLRPAQAEQRHYFNQPLSALQKLTFSIIKPNGTLFNDSTDNINIIKYEYETYNSLYLKVITDKFFDKNEFCVGDSIMVKNVSIVPPSGWSPTPCVTSVAEFQNITDFLNRSQGHEIVQLGDPNENGFYRSFYINAPQTLDQTIGKLVINKGMVDAIREYNIAYPISSVSPAINGNLINISLQITLSFNLTTESFITDHAQITF